MTKLTRPRHAGSGVFRRKFPELTATTRNMAARQTVEGLEHFLFDHVVCNPVFSVRDRNFKKWPKKMKLFRSEYFKNIG